MARLDETCRGLIKANCEGSTTEGIRCGTWALEYLGRRLGTAFFLYLKRRIA